MEKLLLVVLLTFAAIQTDPTAASIIAKTTKDECIVHSGDGADVLKTKSGEVCKQKLVVAMTIQANEGSAQKIQANIGKATDVTGPQAKNVQFENPIRITITKSPVIINFRLFQVGQVSNYPHEVMKKKKWKRCRDDWYAQAHELTCPRVKDKNGKEIFDSQGFCCPCEKNGLARYRGEDVDCLGERGKDWFGHCLLFDEYKYYVMGLYPPQMQFKINIQIEQLSYSKQDGSDVWETVSTLEVGPHKRIARSRDHGIKVTYIADFTPSKFVSVTKLVHRYLLVPNLNHRATWVYKGQPWWEYSKFLISIRNVSEWMAVNKDLFDLKGDSCNKIGVSYSAFRYQSSGCTSKMGSCLMNQPFTLWRKEKEAQKKKRKGLYMLYNFGKVHSAPHTKKLTDYQINFIADHPAKSFITVSMVADDLKVVVHKSPGRIVEAYIDAFEALSTAGELVTLVQNIGKYTSTYNVYVVQCSAGIDMVPSDVVTLDPNQITNVSFVMHSFHALGKINHCEVELCDVDGELLDNMTVYFETLDTCFCYGHCGCACGNNTAVCPEPPPINMTHTPKLKRWFTDLLNSVKGFIGPLGSTLFTSSIIILVLLILGILKVAHMLITGDIKMPAASEPTMMAMQFAKDLAEKALKEWIPQAYDSCVVGCATCTWNCYGMVFYVLTCGQNSKEEKLNNKVERGWRRPKRCNGMCAGAKMTRKKHRKMMRVNKRKGMKGNNMPWFQKPYTCTCKVKDTMPCLQICKGLCFFYYCPLLPLCWSLEFIYTYVKQKWRRHKRKKEFRETRAALEHEKQTTYLHLDRYSRGKVEREILELDVEIKTDRKRNEHNLRLGYTPDVEELKEKEENDEEDRRSSSDTTDADEVGDIDELLNTGQPVYFNYAMPKDTPKSLVNPGKSFSIMGRLGANEKQDSYTFDLHLYTYQLKQVKKRQKKCTPLASPKVLKGSDFEQTFDSATALKLITVSPLFVCLNGPQPT